MSDLAVSRRAVTCALAILPTIAVPTVASAETGLVCLPTSDAAWLAAIEAARTAYVASESFYAANVAPANAARAAGVGSYEAVRAAEDAWGQYNSAYGDAIILTPAPTLAAVAHKLRIGIKECAFDGSDHSMALVKAIADDVQRLGGRA